MGRSYKEIMNAINYDEAKVPAYQLEPLLTLEDGTPVTTAFQWSRFRRPQVKSLLERELYGCTPPRPDRVTREVLSVKNDALEGTAVRKEIRIHFAMNNGRTHFMDMLLYLPKNASAAAPVPAFLGLCFKSLHVTTDEPGVSITGRAYEENPDLGEDKRGCQLERWNFRETIRRGYASATVCYHDIFPDDYTKNNWAKSIYRLFYDDPLAPEVRAKHSAIGAWAWGLSRALDALECEEGIDASRVAVHGHSRLGKTALWAGACDERFKLVISNDSGCGGAALFKRCFGESIESITNVVPYWFVSGFTAYACRELELPFDQHFLLSLISPRALAVASATEDLWADPKGEFLSCVHASEVYRLFGVPGLPVTEMPKPDQVVSGAVSYHLRTGEHEQAHFDWMHYLDLADTYLKNQNL